MNTMNTLIDAIEGSPDKLGPEVTDSGVNFAVFSPGATQLWLLLFAGVTDAEPSLRVKMFRTGDIWHVFLREASDGFFYNYQAEGPFTPDVDGRRFAPQSRLLDPYAPAVVGDSSAIGKGWQAAKCVAYKSSFNWEGDEPLNRTLDETVIYEVLLPAFTRHPSAGCGVTSGTYTGFANKMDHIKELGATAIELMPVCEGDLYNLRVRNPATGYPQPNGWNYDTVAYFAPESDYAYFGKTGQQVDEFKNFVKSAHKQDLEVILDVVFNHTREADHNGPTLSFRGLANDVYYLLMPNNPQLYEDCTGCGNTVRTNHPAVRRFILDCLRYWVSEMHVDGFRFDLAAVFALDENGQQQQKTLLIQEIESDSVLAKTKLIAEPWSIRHYVFGYMSDKRWLEWSDKFRDSTRRFVKGDAGMTAELAANIAGRREQFANLGRRPVNFVTCHDGFTLHDLVSYNYKHNESNGEHNRDGSDNNNSWNCGFEGDVWTSNLADSDKKAIDLLRRKQMKNFLTLLFLSQGIPMLLYGDEMGRSRQGNNNPYCQPALEDLDWSLTEANEDILRFTRKIIAFRGKHQINSQKGCNDPCALRKIVWHGVKPGKPDFSSGARFIAWSYEPYDCGDADVRIYIASNAWWDKLEIELPPGNWLRVVDTAFPSGQDIVSDDSARPLATSGYVMEPRSTVVCIAVNS